MDLEDILVVKLRGFVDGLDSVCGSKEKGGIQGDLQIFGLSNWV